MIERTHYSSCKMYYCIANKPSVFSLIDSLTQIELQLNITKQSYKKQKSKKVLTMRCEVVKAIVSVQT